MVALSKNVVRHSKRIATLAQEGSALYKRVAQWKVRWFHCLYDKNLKQMESDFLILNNEFQILFKEVNAEIHTARDTSSSAFANINVQTLNVSGYINLEIGRMLRMYRHRTLIKTGLVINAFAVVYLLVFVP